MSWVRVDLSSGVLRPPKLLLILPTADHLMLTGIEAGFRNGSSLRYSDSRLGIDARLTGFILPWFVNARKATVVAKGCRASKPSFDHRRRY